MKVKDAMSKRIMFVGKEASAAQAMRIMAENNMRRLMVDVDKANGVFGAVTVRDMIAKVIAPGLDPSKVRVEEVMNTKLVSVGPETTLQEAAKTMEQSNVAGMPVFEGPKLVGVIAMWDILIALGVHGRNT